MCLRVYEVDADVFVFDKKLPFFGHGDWQVLFILQDFSPAGLFNEYAFHDFGDGVGG